MKKLWSVILSVFVLGAVVGIIVRDWAAPPPVHAQSIGFAPLAVMAASASACPPSAAGGWTICGYGTATSGYALCVSFNAGACTTLSTGTAGVTSFNGRTGAVVPAAGDYSFAQVSGTATTAQLPAVVNSFNGRTGNVLPASGDYSFGLLTGQVAPAQVPALTTTVTSTATTVVQ
jgi:hypothetical protein